MADTTDASIEEAAPDAGAVEAVAEAEAEAEAPMDAATEALAGNGAAPPENPPIFDFAALGESSVAVAPAEFVPLESEVLPGADAETIMDLGVLATIPLQVTVELGRTQMQVREVLALQPGSVVELDRVAGEAVDVRINERLVARGEVVIIADKFGIRLTEIMAGATAMLGGAR